MQSSQLARSQSRQTHSTLPQPATNTSLPSLAKYPSSKEIHDAEPAFICTICWAPQPHSSKPKLLGTSARIVCQPCWRAVLDLSICWVCGECIVRGDDVVSLGWCFWHRACFGCLVCGSRMNVPEYNLRPEITATAMGIELDIIPLCSVCSVETVGESEERILEMSLDTVTRYDGGLSKDRLEMLSEGKEERKKIATDGSTSAYCDPSPTDERASLLSNAADMGVLPEEDECHIQSDVEDASTFQRYFNGPEREIYISVLNPTSEPPFQPSKTKPLPKWMQLLPNNIHRGRERGVTITSCHAAYLEDTETVQASDSFAKLEIERDRTPIAAPTQSCSSTPPLEGTQKRKRAAISFDPKIVGAQEAEVRANRRSRTIYMTPPEHPFPSVPSRSRTPFPQPVFDHSDMPNDYFSQGYEETLEIREISPTASEPPTPKTSLFPVTPPLFDTLSRTGPGYYEQLLSFSSEYLERYHPKSPGTRYERYVVKETEPILEKIKRQKVGKLNMREVAKEVEERREMKKRVIKGKGRMVNDELGLNVRTEDLQQKEFRNLFCEE